MNPGKRHEIFSRLRAANPHPTTELEYGTPFELLVAVVLSAQATDKGVNLATRRLFPVANTPEAIYALGEAGLTEYIKTIGLYKSKAKHLIAACRMLVELHDSQVPAERAALEALPGGGRKTANVILNTAFGQPTMAVDTHIFRVANRTGLAPGETVLEVERKLLKTIPAEFRIDAHHWLILHGRYVCQARKPKCGECIIADLCEFKGKLLATAGQWSIPAAIRSASSSSMSGRSTGPASRWQARSSRHSMPCWRIPNTTPCSTSPIVTGSGITCRNPARSTLFYICPCIWQSPSRCRSTSRPASSNATNVYSSAMATPWTRSMTSWTAWGK